MVKMRGKKELVDSLVELIEATGMDDIVMVEVGSYAGESASIFCSTGKVKSLTCIDPWKSGYDEKDIASSSDFTQVEEEFGKVIDKYPTIIRKFKGVLADFVDRSPDFRPDLVYIDACHTYEGCKEDIANALKLNPKVISGHDYCEGWRGVKKAVDEQFGHPDRVFGDGSWMVVRL